MSNGQDGQVVRVGQEGQDGQVGQEGSACGHAEARIRNPSRGASEVSRRGWGPAASEKAGPHRNSRKVGRCGCAAGLLLTLCGIATTLHAQDARQIVDEAQRRTASKSQRYEGFLQVIDANGRTSDKRWTLERLGSHGSSRMVLRFTAPPEVKGVALLVVNHPDRASDQWMWTPAIERDRRIALQDRSTRFFGTDFSFEDLEERDVDQYDYTMQRDETIDGAACWRIRSVPKQRKSSQYTHSIVWIRKDNHAFARIESYVKDRAVRRLDYGDLQNVQGIWTARRLEMTDLRRGSRTRLTLDTLQYNVPMKEEDFTLQALRRP